MKTQIISQQHNPLYFQGNVTVSGKTDIETLKQINEALPVLKKIFKNKPYDLFIEEKETFNCLQFTVKSNRTKQPPSTVTLTSGKLRNATSFYCDMANYVRKEFEKSKVYSTSLEMIKDYIVNLGKNLFKGITKK